MDVNEKLTQLLQERGWSAYKLAKNSGLSQTTIANIFKRNTLPSIPTLEAICKGFSISVSQFFSENEMVELTPELKELFDRWIYLTTEQKQATIKIIETISCTSVLQK